MWCNLMCSKCICKLKYYAWEHIIVLNVKYELAADRWTEVSRGSAELHLNVVIIHVQSQRTFKVTFRRLSGIQGPLHDKRPMR